MDTLLWTVIPYAALASFAAGHVWRWRHDRWEAGRRRERPALRRGARWDVRLVHIGVAALAVDVASLPLLRPSGGAAWALRTAGLAVGIAGAALMTIGLVGICRTGLPGRGGAPRRPGAMDWLTFALLFSVLSFGLWEAVGINTFLFPHDAGRTIGRWLRDLLTLHPDASEMAAATVDDRWHVGLIVLLVGVWPYTRLVHAWHAPAEAWLRRASRRAPERGRRSAAASGGPA